MADALQVPELQARRERRVLCRLRVDGSTSSCASASTGFGGFAAIIVALFVYVSMIGAVMPLTAARAMAPHGAIAGNASALMGTLQFGAGALAGVALGALQNETAFPMALVVALCGAGGWVVRRLLVR
jgi:DHA1 family bicyclomycin/chloramphenicol resistance-like MFS transporter